MEDSEIKDVASFWYSLNWPQMVPFEDFISINHKLLKKISCYDYEQWSNAIEETGDLLDSLIWLNSRWQPTYGIYSARTTRAKFILLSQWEMRWGTLPKKFRIGFIRHPRFKNIEKFDLEILEGLFAQHKKFDSVISHLFGLHPDYLDSELEISGPHETPFDDEEISLFSELSFEEFSSFYIVEGLASPEELADQTGIDIEWSPDDLDSEEIVFALDAEDFDKEF